MAEPRQSQALSKRSSDTALMPPPPPPKRIKRPTKVLDEDVYTDTLSHIIARDFFPGLMETQAQQEYLEAVESKNKDWTRDAGGKLRQAMTPGPGGRGRRGTSMAPTPRQTGDTQTPRYAKGDTQTPRHTKDTPRGWGGHTPRQAPSETPTSAGGDARPQQPEVDHTLSLGAFQSKYTSEDNESFNSLLDRQNIKRAEDYAFLFNGNRLPSVRQIEYHRTQQKLLQQASSSSSSSSSSTALVPLRPSQNPDDRSTTIETFTSRQGPRNTLMFAPDGIEDTHTTTFQTASERSLAPPKSVSYAATRLPSTNPDDPASIPPSPSLSAIDAAIAGRPRASSTDAGYSGAETPRVAGYAFVDAEPTPEEMGIPVTDEEAERQEQAAMMSLMPQLEAGHDKNPFKLQSASKREELHHRIVDKQNSQRRKPGDRLGALKAGGGGGTTPGRTPTPSFKSSPAVTGAAGTKRGNLTPAARMLAASIAKTPKREGSLFGNVGRIDGAKVGPRAWTPTPRVKRV